MGIFSKLFGTKDSTPAMKDYSFIADIAAFITDNDSEVVSKLRECANDPWAYAEKNTSRYLQRGVVVSDRAANDIDDICWIGMIDELEENGYLFLATIQRRSRILSGDFHSLKLQLDRKLYRRL